MSGLESSHLIGSESYETDKEIIVLANFTSFGIFNKVFKNNEYVLFHEENISNLF